jgi:hypothetical protein
LEGAFVCTITDNSALLLAWPGWRPQEDFELEVDARFVSPDSRTFNSLGLAFGGTDDWNDFYTLVLAQGGEQHLWAPIRFVNAKGQYLANGGYRLAPDFVRPRFEWNRLMVRSIGDRIFMYGNGQRLHDEPIVYERPGDGVNRLVGLVALSYEFDHGILVFDNYRLAPLAPLVIAGSVRDESGAPMAGVAISAGAAGSTTTDDSGAYAFAGLAAGTYTLVPELDGYALDPKSRTVSVPPGTVVEDFVGHALRRFYLPCLIVE